MRPVRPLDESDELLARRGYVLHPDYDEELYHVIWLGPDPGDEASSWSCIGVVTQPSKAAEYLEAVDWPTGPVLGWSCRLHKPDEEEDI